MSEEHMADRVRIEPEHFIPVPKHRIVTTLLQRVNEEQKPKFKDFCKLIEAIYHFQYHDTSQELKQDFQLFDNAEGKLERSLCEPAEIASAEERFLQNFIKMMQKANFRLLTQDDVDLAEAEDYLFNLPVIIDWDKLDTELLDRYFAQHQYGDNGVKPPEFANRILMFRRGVGVDQANGFHLLAKIDLLVTRLLEWLISFPKKWFGKKAPEPAAAVVPEEQPAPEERKARGSIFQDRFIQRKTLKSSNVGFFSLFRRTLLQEPTFKELIILFRFAATRPRKGPEVRDPAIHIKAFREIPMADLEVVFPEKKISMQTVDLIKLVITGTIGLVVVVVKFVFTAALNPVVALAALGTIGGYVAKIFVGFKASKDRYQHLVTHSLYHKNLDNDLGVIFFLMDSLEEQEFKEAVLAYYFLWQQGPCTEEEVDGHCERFLSEHFGVEVDFEADDALQKLIDDQLIVEEEGKFRACPLEEALRVLDEKWDNYFKYNNGDESPGDSGG